MSETHTADHEKRISLIEQNNQQTRATMESMNSKLDAILAQITRVAILEEKHQTQQIDVTRAHSRVGKLETDVDVLARETRAFINYSQGRDKVLWSLGGAVLLLAVKVVFFTASHGMTP